MHKDIIGGVSPLKKVVKAKRSGHRGASKPGDRNYGREATSTEKRRGGFSKVTSSTNRGGYNVRTRFKVDPWVKPASGGDRTPTKPYSYDADGKMQVDPMATKKWTDPVIGGTTTEKTEKARSSYRDSYDAMEDRNGGKYNKRNKKIYTTFEEYEADAIQFNKDNPDYKEYETKTVTKESKDGYWTYYDEDGGEISKEEYSKYKNKK